MYEIEAQGGNGRRPWIRTGEVFESLVEAVREAARAEHLGDTLGVRARLIDLDSNKTFDWVDLHWELIGPT